MSKAEAIAKLQSLLARIQSRAAEGRPPRDEARALPPTAPPAVETVSEGPLRAPIAQEVAEASASEGDRESIDVPIDLPAWAQPSIGDEADIEGDADLGVDVDVEVDLTEAGPEIEPSAAGQPVLVSGQSSEKASESVERLVAAHPVAIDVIQPAEAAIGALAPSADAMGAAVPAGADAAAAEDVARGLATESLAPASPADTETFSADESNVEPAPASSRRALGSPPEERLAQLAFGAEEPGTLRHTPPPESGRVPAAPTDDFDADVTGVRQAAPSSKGGADRQVHPPQPVTPEATHAVLEASGPVAVIAEITPAAAAPRTFIELLDRALSL